MNSKTFNTLELLFDVHQISLQSSNSSNINYDMTAFVNGIDSIKGCKLILNYMFQNDENKSDFDNQCDVQLAQTC